MKCLREESAPDVMCHYILIDEFIRIQDLGKASEVWERLVESPIVYPNVVTYNVIISGLCKCGKTNLEVWERMSNEGEMDLFTYSSWVHAFYEAWNLEAAERVYKEMIESGVLADTVLCNSMLYVYSNLGKIKECFKLWKVVEK